MFGDHQPSVEQEFLDMAYGVSEDGMTMEQYMDKFKVPFVIWANYPLTGEKPGITSLNFLAQYVLRRRHPDERVRLLSLEFDEDHSGDDVCRLFRQRGQRIQPPRDDRNDRPHQTVSDRTV